FSAEADPASSYLIDLPDLGGGERWLGHHMLDMKADVFSPDSDAITADSAAEPVRWSMVLGAVALLVVGIVISAAFAVGARRQLVSLGQLSASGASPATIRTSLVLQGTVTGVAGAVAGLVIATLALG